MNERLTLKYVTEILKRKEKKEKSTGKQKYGNEVRESRTNYEYCCI